MDYRREIDGLRALAVLPVILFHAGFETFSGGFVGVDVFFVISGYLITSIILGELEHGAFSLVNFYERRVRRILPALFCVMFVCMPFAWLWLLPSDMKDFAHSLAAVPMFVSNVLFWQESGYFDTEAELKPLLHTWSLAVEEQYYLLFPLFMMLCWRLGKLWIVGLLACVFVGSLSGAEWGSQIRPAAAFFLLPARGWELLLGSFALVPTVGAALVILFATQQTSVGKFVGNRAFVAIGLISYSAYLWHQPLFAFARSRSLTDPGPWWFAALSVLSLILAYLTWRFVETPWRKKISSIEQERLPAQR